MRGICKEQCWASNLFTTWNNFTLMASINNNKTVRKQTILFVFFGLFYWVETTAFKNKKKRRRRLNSNLLWVSIKLYSSKSVKEIVLLPCFFVVVVVVLHHKAFFRNALTFSLTQKLFHFQSSCEDDMPSVVWALSRCRTEGLQFAFLWRLLL